MDFHKLAWLTDIHLNFLQMTDRKKFYQSINESTTDAILMTGDIAEANSVCELLSEFSMHTDKPIYFVLGNHDYYSGGVRRVREKILNFCAQHNKIIWLGKPEMIAINHYTFLVGQDGWADARYGDFDHSSLTLNDSRFITELYQALLESKSSLKDQMQKLADADAKALQQTLEKAIHATIKNIIIATHVPPFPECAWYKDKPSNDDWLPYFSSKATGDVISAIVQKNPTINFLVLCGHTHTKASFSPFQNLLIKTGKAHYYRPELQEIISF